MPSAPIRKAEFDLRVRPSSSAAPTRAPKSSGTSRSSRIRPPGDRQRTPDAAHVDGLGPDDEIDRALGEQLAGLLEVDVRACARVAALLEHVEVAPARCRRAAPARARSRARPRAIRAGAVADGRDGDERAPRSRRASGRGAPPRHQRQVSKTRDVRERPRARSAAAVRRDRRSARTTRPIDERVAEMHGEELRLQPLDERRSGATPASATGQPRARTAGRAARRRAKPSANQTAYASQSAAPSATLPARKTSTSATARRSRRRTRRSRRRSRAARAARPAAARLERAPERDPGRRARAARRRSRRSRGSRARRRARPAANVAGRRERRQRGVWSAPALAAHGALRSARDRAAVRPSWLRSVGSAPRASSSAASASLPLAQATISGVSPNWSRTFAFGAAVEQERDDVGRDRRARRGRAACAAARRGGRPRRPRSTS